jgi:hypothetical protein
VGGHVREDAPVAAQAVLEPVLDEEATSAHAQAQAGGQGSPVILHLGREGVQAAEGETNGSCEAERAKQHLGQMFSSGSAGPRHGAGAPTEPCLIRDVVR